MVDRITLTGLSAVGHHGVHGHERTSGQGFLVDAELEVDLTAARLSDDLSDTVDYGEVADAIVTVVEGPPLHLIEAVAGRIAGTILEGFPLVRAVTVTVHKPHAPLPHQFSDVAVTLRRTRG